MTRTSPPPRSIDWDAYALPDETLELLETARAHFAALTSLDDLRAMLDGGPAPALWHTLTEHGYTAIGLPESCDGIGTRVDAAALLEEAGRSLLPAPLTSHAAAAQTLLSAGLESAVSTDDQAAIALTQTDTHVVGFDAIGARTLVQIQDIGSTEGARVQVFEIDPGASESRPGPDPTRPNVAFARRGLTVMHDVTVAASADALLAAARTCVAADLTGTAQRALDGAIAHALTRRQFDRIIGSFQAIKHVLADAHVAIERCRSLTVGAAVALDADPLSPESTVLSLLAKASAAEAAADAASLHVQILGAMGLTFEADSALEVRRARHTAHVLGSPSELFARAAHLPWKDEASQ